jgi:hypothetical protein
MKKIIAATLFVLYLVTILSLSIRGVVGNPDEQSLYTNYYRDGGPFELSPERGRFALTYALAEYASPEITAPLARFAAPDVGFAEDKFVSIFAPAVSFIVLPGYMIGKLLGSSQVGTFAVVSLFGLVNFSFIVLIAKKLNAGTFASLVGGMVFLFATPAFAYATTLYQHHITVALLLSSVYALIHLKGFWSLSWVAFAAALSISVDNPNVFLFIPLLLKALGSVVSFKQLKNQIKINVSLLKSVAFIFALIPIALFMYFNDQVYGSPFRLAGSIPSVSQLTDDGEPVFFTIAEGVVEELSADVISRERQDVVGFFNTRNSLNGLYILLLSPDRGVLVFTPVILMGLFGILLLYKNNNQYLSLLLSIVLVNLFLYSMWGDPWGGWAFGSRYLIPAYAIMSIFVALALTDYSKNKLFLVGFSIIMVYSIAVNTLGAITTNTNPPKIEAIPL